MQIVKPKKEWKLGERAFEGLLKWFDEGTNSNGRTYLEMRRRLAAYFDRKNCLAPDDLADETLNRVARRLEEEGVIETESAAKYCYIVARFVFMEYLRELKRSGPMNERHPQSTGGAGVLTVSAEESADDEARLDCLDKCTAELGDGQRELIIGYYVGKERVRIENRRALARRLSITVNALSIRACRIRDKLEACVRECVSS